VEINMLAEKQAWVQKRRKKDWVEGLKHQTLPVSQFGAELGQDPQQGIKVSK
jgi:hypothetical protein